MDMTIPKPKARFRKGDAFVEMVSHPILLMEINEVENSTENMDFCIVTWYILDENGLNTQHRFPMIARDGVFSNFEPVSRKFLKEAKSIMRQYDADVKHVENKIEARLLSQKYNRKLIELLPDAEERLSNAQQKERRIETNRWLECTDDNYWVEDKSELNDGYFTLICLTFDTYDDKNDKTITEQSIFLYDNCPYGWSTLVKNGAKYMVIEKPKR